MIVKNLRTGLMLKLNVDADGVIGVLHAKRLCPNLRVEAKTLDDHRTFLLAFADLDIVIPAIPIALIAFFLGFHPVIMIRIAAGCVIAVDALS